MSMDNAWLYVTNNGSASLSVIDLSNLSVSQTVLLPSKPQGVAVGADGRALVSMVGTGVVGGSSAGHLIRFRPDAVAVAAAPVRFRSRPAHNPGAIAAHHADNASHHDF